VRASRRLNSLAPVGLAAGATGAVALLALGAAPVWAWVVVVALWIAALRSAGAARARERAYAESVAQLHETVERWSSGDLDSRVYLDADDPLDQVAHGMNRVAEVLESRTADLARDRDRLDAILANMQDGFVIFDRALYVTLINRRAEVLFGVAPGAALGRHVLEVVRATTIESALQRATLTGRPEAVEWSPNPREDVLIECGVAPVRDPGGGYGAILMTRDVTAQRRLERMRSDFVANVSHELQTPLTTIIGFAETLSDVRDLPGDQAERFIGLIHDEARRLSRLVDDLLALSRLEHHSLVARRDPVDIRRLMAEVALQLAGRAAEAAVAVSVEDGPAIAMAGDADLLREVLLNLVANGIQYTPAGGTVTLRAERTDQGRVRLTVSDTGIGIPPDDLPRIFERFYRVDRARSRRSGGTGLGLAIVKHVVELLHGTIAVQSTPQVGSTFVVDLPDPGLPAPPDGTPGEPPSSASG
jgi:two-component system phosphate regulon sensor histidine kinase PhoR